MRFNFKKLIPDMEQEISSLPQSLKGTAKRRKNLQKKVEEIKKGSYIPTKTDLQALKKTYKKQSIKKEIDKYIKTFDTDKESFYLYETAKDYKTFSNYDLVVKVLFSGKYTHQYVMYGFTSDRFDNRVSDRQVINTIEYQTKGDMNGYTAMTGSGGVYSFDNYKIVDSFRQY